VIAQIHGSIAYRDRSSCRRQVRTPALAWEEGIGAKKEEQGETAKRRGARGGERDDNRGEKREARSEKKRGTLNYILFKKIKCSHRK
jgi:hypothetical protein